MRVHLYTGSLRLVEKSGVGQAVHHQNAMLEAAGVEVVTSWKQPADVVHINTVLPDAPLAALRAKLRGEAVVYYGHSTMQDFRNSFVGSNALAPLFRRWICFCYNRGDIVVTPTNYSKQLLDGYGLKRQVVPLSNGVDTAFFAPNAAAGQRFRAAYGFAASDKVVISVGHTIGRKGILDFIATAKALPQYRFVWFGYTAPALVPEEIRTAMDSAPQNLLFAGYVDQAALRDAYCGADAFAFCSHEETEGIVVLEALACGVPTLVRDIPVYADWLQDGQNAYKASDCAGFVRRLDGMLTGSLPSLADAGRTLAESRNIAAMGQKLCHLYASQSATPYLAPQSAFAG